MKLVIEINMTNDAFVNFRDAETARILRNLATRIDGHPHFSPGHDYALHDINGNEVGYCVVLKDKQELSIRGEWTCPSCGRVYDNTTACASDDCLSKTGGK